MKLLSFPKLIHKDASHTPTLALIVTVAASVAALTLVLPTNSGHAQVDEPAHSGQAYQLAQSDELTNPDPGGGGGGTSGNGSNNTDPGAQPNCYAYDSTGNNENDGEGGEVCLENLSADPTELNSGSSTAITWEINYSPSTTGDILVRCNLTGSGIEPELIGAESSPTILDYDDFEGTTAITVTCEAADDLELGQPENYDDFSDQITVTINESGGDGNTAPTAINDGNNQIQICADDDIDINVLDNDSDSVSMSIESDPTDVTPEGGDTTYYDSDGDPLRVSGIVSQPENPDGSANPGTATIIPDNPYPYEINFEPQAGFTGTTTFEYKLSDGQDQTDDSVAEVTVDVQGPDGGCGDVIVTFEKQDGSPVSATANPQYAGTALGSQSGTSPSWNVTLENTPKLATMRPGNSLTENITPPEGYQLEKNFQGDPSIGKDTPLIAELGPEEGDLTKEPTSALLGKDYEPETPTVTCYSDQDGDGFGNPDTDIQRDSCQTGEVQNGDDCYDQNPNANPNQGEFFSEPRGDGSFDYNCNNTADKEYTKTYEEEATCEPRDSAPDCEWSNPDNVSTGWQDSVPDCGDSGTYYEQVYCSGECADGSIPPCDSGRPVCSVDRDTDENRTQKCR